MADDPKRPSRDTGGRAGGEASRSTPPAPRPAQPPTPFPSEDEEWESELAAWDAAIPIVNRRPAAAGSSSAGPQSPSPAASGAATRSPPTEAGARGGGALPNEENPFFETPATVVPQGGQVLDLDDLPDVVSAGIFDDGVAPASGSYAVLVASDQSVPGIFDRDPAPEGPPVFPTPTLPEMESETWRGEGADVGVARLINVGDAAVSASPDRAYLQGLAELISEERAAERGADRAVALGLAAARVAETLQQDEQALQQLEGVFALDPGSLPGHRARLRVAERMGRMDDAAAQESLARLALSPHPDQLAYRALYAEWTLSRTAGVAEGAPSTTAAATAIAAVTATPPGLGRLLAEAELAAREPVVAAAILENAAHHVGGALGSALLLYAAGLNELAKDFQAAAEQRLVAARLAADGTLISLGVLRDLARLEGEAVMPALHEVLGRMPPSELKVSLARWGASKSLRAGNALAAWRLIAEPGQLGPMTGALARDRLEVWAAARAAARADEISGGALDAGPPAVASELVATAGQWWRTPVARVGLALRACELADGPTEAAAALATTADAIGAVGAGGDRGEVTALGPALEELAARTADRATRLRALRLWRQVDWARWASASLELADALPPLEEGGLVSGEGASESAESVLRELAGRDPTSPAFWSLSALRAHQGRFAEAASLLDEGTARSAWRSSVLAAPLAELAAEMTARVDPAAGAARLAAAATLSVSGGGALARVARQLGDRDLWAEYVKDELMGAPARPMEVQSPAGPAARERRASLLLEPVFWPERGTRGPDPSRASRVRASRTDDRRSGDEDVPALVAAALAAVPLHPVAFALALGGQPPPALLVDILAGRGSAPGAARWLLGAAITAAVSGDARRGLALAADLHGDHHSDVESRIASSSGMNAAVSATIRRLAWAAPDSNRGRVLLSLARSDARADTLVEAAEAAEALAVGTGQEQFRTEAQRLFEAAAFAAGAEAVSGDVRLGLQRLAALGGDRATRPWGAVEGRGADRRRDRDRLRSLEADLRASRWDQVVTRLIDSPPHEAQASAATLSLAATIDEGRIGGRRATAVWKRARAALDLDRSKQRRAGSPGSPGSPGSKGGALRAAALALLRAGDDRGADPVDAGNALEQLAEVAAAGAPDERSAGLLFVEAAHLAALAPPGDEGREQTEQRRLRAAVRHDPTSAAATVAWRRWLQKAGRIEEAARASAAEAEALVEPALRLHALRRAAELLLGLADGQGSPTGSSLDSTEGAVAPGAEPAAQRLDEAARFLERALQIAPQDQQTFTRLRELYDRTGRWAELASLLAVRLKVTSNPFEVTALHLARAELFAGPLGDRGSAKLELETILQKEPRHARALGELADLEQEDGNDSAAADLLIRQAFTERSPERLRELFLRLGRIYTERIPDAKRAVGAYARVLQLDPDNREALDELSRLYLGLGETKSAISITERLVRIETSAEGRSEYHVRLAQLAERAGDPRAATAHFRRAVEEAPRDVEALGELVRHLDKTRDIAGRRAYLDRAAGELRAAIFADPTDSSALVALVAVLRWRGRAAAAAAAAEVLASLAAWGNEPSASTASPPRVELSPPAASALPDWATAPPGGRRLAALLRPSVDEQTFPAVVPSSVRHLFGLLAPLLFEGGKGELARMGVERADRVPPGRPPRDIFDAVAAELGAGPFDLYVPSRSPSAGPPLTAAALSGLLMVQPGKPPAVVVGAPLLGLGTAAVRFAAGRTLRLVATHLDVALAGGPGDLGVWIGGIVRQFNPDYRHPSIPADLIANRAARVAKLLPRKLRHEITPYAMESSGELELMAIHAGIRDGVNRVGLLASGSLAASLRVVLTGAAAGAPVASWMTMLSSSAEAQALLQYALSDEYDELVKELE